MTQSKLWIFPARTWWFSTANCWHNQRLPQNFHRGPWRHPPRQVSASWRWIRRRSCRRASSTWCSTQLGAASWGGPPWAEKSGKVVEDDGRFSMKISINVVNYQCINSSWLINMAVLGIYQPFRLKMMAMAVSYKWLDNWEYSGLYIRKKWG